MSTAVDISVLGATVGKARGCIGQDKGGLQNDLPVIGGPQDILKNKEFVGYAEGAGLQTPPPPLKKKKN